MCAFPTFMFKELEHSTSRFYSRAIVVLAAFARCGRLRGAVPFFIILFFVC
uniref:Uncharacterized protein n=1 Tax=Arundo donax TaxID=35708 RepID=A0A0A9IIB4_ARUDO